MPTPTPPAVFHPRRLRDEWLAAGVALLAAALYGLVLPGLVR